MPSDQERLASLETGAKHIQETLEEVRTDVKAIIAKQQQQSGFIAGMLFIITPLWGAALWFIKSIWEKVTS